MAKNNQNLVLLAVEKGYVVHKDGHVSSNKTENLKLKTHKQGYKTFTIRVSKTQKMTLTVHRLQAYQKYGDKVFDENLEVRHLNGNPGDNSFDNIVLGTHQENMLDIDKETRRRMASNANKKYRNVSEIREYYNDVKSYSKTMEHFGISSRGTLHFILHSSMV